MQENQELKSRLQLEQMNNQLMSYIRTLQMDVKVLETRVAAMESDGRRTRLNEADLERMIELLRS